MYYTMKHNDLFLPKPLKWHQIYWFIFQPTSPKQDLEHFEIYAKFTQLTINAAFSKTEKGIKKILDNYIIYLTTLGQCRTTEEFNNYDKTLLKQKIIHTRLNSYIIPLTDINNWTIAEYITDPQLDESVQIMDDKNPFYKAWRNARKMIHTISSNKKLSAYCIRCKHVIPTNLEFIKIGKNKRCGICPLCLIDLGQISQLSVDSYADQEYLDKMRTNRFIENL